MRPPIGDVYSRKPEMICEWFIEVRAIVTSTSGMDCRISQYSSSTLLIKSNTNLKSNFVRLINSIGCIYLIQLNLYNDNVRKLESLP